MSNIKVSFFNVSSKFMWTFIPSHAGLTAWGNRPLWSLHQNNTATRFFLINNNFLTRSKLFTPNMYCWTCKMLVTIYWTHLRLNGICAKSFCHSKQITEGCSLWDDFNGNIAPIIYSYLLTYLLTPIRLWHCRPICLMCYWQNICLYFQINFTNHVEIYWHAILKYSQSISKSKQNLHGAIRRKQMRGVFDHSQTSKSKYLYVKKYVYFFIMIFNSKLNKVSLY